MHSDILALKFKFGCMRKQPGHLWCFGGEGALVFAEVTTTNRKFQLINAFR